MLSIALKKNVVQVMRKSHEARQKLLRLGIFRKVEVVIDTSRGAVYRWLPGCTFLNECTFIMTHSTGSSGEDALPNGLDVTFEVTELRRMTGSYNTMVGNNEGSMVSLRGGGCLQTDSISFWEDYFHCWLQQSKPWSSLPLLIFRYSAWSYPMH